MRLVATARCIPGMELAKPIFNEKGMVLLGRGVVLTQRMIDNLRQHQIPVLYIQDKATADIELNDVISHEVRVEAMNSIQTVFSAIEKDTFRWRGTQASAKIADEFKKVFAMLYGELRQTKEAMNMLVYTHVKENYVFSHSLNVTLYTTAVAIKRGFNTKQLSEIGMGALLHDVGKLFIPQGILHKPGRLTEEEFEQIKKHTEHGFELLRKTYEIPLSSAHCAYQHHEKLNGSGYPRGLKGDEIHPFAKVLSVCDVFDALTTHRVYRRSMLPHEAMELIYTETHTHFDVDIVEAFRSTIAIYPIGLTVKVNTGETAIVIGQNRDAPTRPILRVIKDAGGHSVSSYYDIDLMKDLSVMIVECDTV
jgi:putative nucleotidyltransferase with HDIG domain